MSATFVDTNVLLDVTNAGSAFFDWSADALTAAKQTGALVANAVVYGEFCAGYNEQDEVDRFLDALKLELLDVPRDAIFLASRAFKSYKNRGGTRTGVLPDFFIGAHALSLNIPLITRDTARYATNFPTLQLIAPPL
jgi:predicted nucleic acid-binding protein